MDTADVSWPLESELLAALRFYDGQSTGMRTDRRSEDEITPHHANSSIFNFENSEYSNGQTRR